MVNKEAEEAARREYVRRQQEIKAAEGTAPTLPTESSKLQMDKFLQTVTSQASSDDYILGTELTSQDVYGPVATTPGIGTTEKPSSLVPPKAENAQQTKDSMKPTVKCTPFCSSTGFPSIIDMLYDNPSLPGCSTCTRTNWDMDA
uniref:Uncharacterized protein n=1 Tax=Romanomermis culicivorax TaxID=13658 RepID=A0A915JTT7_ROMCU